MEISNNEKYILNSEYVFRTDKNRILLFKSNLDSHFCVFIHPMIAIMLSFFTGRDTLDEVVDKISIVLGIHKRKLLPIIKSFVNNEKSFCMSYDGETFFIPVRILVKNVKDIRREDISLDRFIISSPYDFKTYRLNVPTNILFVLNTKCVTNCIYCYADKIAEYKLMPLERALVLVDEAASLGINKLDLSGGEIFLYKDWEILLKKIFEKGFRPDISTKFPLTEQQIDLLYKLGLRNIQVSLDAMEPCLLEKTLNVPKDYGKKIQETIINLDRKGFSIIVRSTLTRETCTVENIKSLLGFIDGLPNVYEYDCMPAGYSLYKSIEDFNKFKPTIDQLIDIKDFFEQIEESNYSFSIKYDDSIVTDGSECCCTEAFNNRAMCTANVDTMIILPDGKVTICEQLYWNKHFLIGDVIKNSLVEVWQSERAKSLWKLSQERIPSDSLCKECQEFEKCRYQRGVCWKDVIAVYGEKHWYYPDIRCPKAPKPMFPVFYDNSFI